MVRGNREIDFTSLEGHGYRIEDFDAERGFHPDHPDRTARGPFGNDDGEPRRRDAYGDHWPRDVDEAGMQTTGYGTRPDEPLWPREVEQRVPWHVTASREPLWDAPEYGAQSLPQVELDYTVRHARALAGRSEGPHRGRGPRTATSDPRLLERVCDALTDSHDVDATDIVVTVLDGEVTLEGTVADRRMKRVAEDLALAIRGVVDVHNRLRHAPS